MSLTDDEIFDFVRFAYRRKRSARGLLAALKEKYPEYRDIDRRGRAAEILERIIATVPADVLLDMVYRLSPDDAVARKKPAEQPSEWVTEERMRFAARGASVLGARIRRAAHDIVEAMTTEPASTHQGAAQSDDNGAE